jgi:methylenetetrahydrofolate dehydrogenase (NADP+)/methenyltetrahydrofolate cyclohydrolase
MAYVVDGKALANSLKTQAKADAADFAHRYGRPPQLTVILVGEDPASQSYIRAKERACRRALVDSTLVSLPATITSDELLAVVAGLNQDPRVDGLLVQLPLPEHIDPEPIVAAISPLKDVDCFHPENLGLLLRGRPRFAPCTPAGIEVILDSLGLDFAGKDAVVVGRSLIVGRPMAMLLIERNLTVTICHSRTEDLATKVRQADLIVAAVGVPGFIRGDWIKPGAVVIDVGTNYKGDGLVGDVAFAEALPHVGVITPVPGGVGPLTVTQLLRNVITAAGLHRQSMRDET